MCSFSWRQLTRCTFRQVTNRANVAQLVPQDCYTETTSQLYNIASILTVWQDYILYTYVIVELGSCSALHLVYLECKSLLELASEPHRGLVSPAVVDTCKTCWTVIAIDGCSSANGCLDTSLTYCARAFFGIENKVTIRSIKNICNT